MRATATPNVADRRNQRGRDDEVAERHGRPSEGGPAVKTRLALLVALCLALLIGSPSALADSSATSDTSATHRYISLGDSLKEAT
jgi:hypothetical protein